MDSWLSEGNGFTAIGGGIMVISGGFPAGKRRPLCVGPPTRTRIARQKLRGESNPSAVKRLIIKGFCRRFSSSALSSQRRRKKSGGESNSRVLRW
eukprot:377537-Prorocentrum_minimum.AAC.4